MSAFRLAVLLYSWTFFFFSASVCRSILARKNDGNGSWVGGLLGIYSPRWNIFQLGCFPRQSYAAQVFLLLSGFPRLMEGGLVPPSFVGPHGGAESADWP